MFPTFPRMAMGISWEQGHPRLVGGRGLCWDWAVHGFSCGTGQQMDSHSQYRDSHMGLVNIWTFLWDWSGPSYSHRTD